MLCSMTRHAWVLIKVRLGQNCPVEKKQAARELADRTGSHLIQLIGKTVLLYKPSPDLPRDQGIKLPR